MRRDPKGLYGKAIRGEVKAFTGISSPYEAPEDPEIQLDNDEGVDPETKVSRVIEYLRDRDILPSDLFSPLSGSAGKIADLARKQS